MRKKGLTTDNAGIAIVAATPDWEAVWRQEGENIFVGEFAREPIIAWALHWHADNRGRCKITRREPITLSDRVVEAVSFLRSELGSSIYPPEPPKCWVFLDRPNTILESAEDVDFEFQKRVARKKKKQAVRLTWRETA